MAFINCRFFANCLLPTAYLVSVFKVDNLHLSAGTDFPKALSFCLLPIADCLLRRTDGCEEEANVLGRPGDDLLSRVLRQSTIGAEAFDGRVRDGIGSDRLAEGHQAGEER